MGRPPMDMTTHQSVSSHCFFCGHKTPSTLCAVRSDGSVVVPKEIDSFSLTERFLADRNSQDIQTYYELVNTLAPYNHLPDDVVVRVFPNLTPALVSSSDENCLVVGIANNQWHECDIPDLPPKVIRAVIRAWQFLELVCEERGLILVPFWNRGSAAGASVQCPHAQAYLLHRTPALYFQIAERREARQRCGVCEILAQEDLLVWKNETFRLMAHPAPARIYTLFAAPKACGVSRLQEIDQHDLAELLIKATSAWRKQFDGVMPAFNILIRTGDVVGHLHLELVPRDDTKPRINVDAGFELASGESIITLNPRDVVQALKEHIGI